jgi:hypothetical protein
MNVVGASETVVPHAVAEGYQRTKKYAKRYDWQSGETFIGNGK